MFSQQSSWNFTINNCSCYHILKVIQITKLVVLKKIKTYDFLYFFCITLGKSYGWGQAYDKGQGQNKG